MSESVRVAINGAAGRMGRMLVQAVAERDGLSLVGALERADAPDLGRDAGELAGLGAAGVAITADPAEALARADVFIDFSVPEATLALLDRCVAGGVAMVIGTTGFDAGGRARIETASGKIAVMMAPNMSVGVNLLFDLVRRAAEVLGDDVDVEIIEAHHRHKVDAPSGTALRIGEVVAEVLGRNLETDAVYGRQGRPGARDRRTIGFATIRGGDIVGDHTVLYAGEGERLEITHRSGSRMTFAVGAVRAASWVAGRAPGMYSMQDVLSLDA